MNRPPKIPPQKQKLLEGFESLYDLLEDDDEQNEAKKKGRISDGHVDDNYDLYFFLETEIKRLNKGHLLLGQKLDNLLQNPQGQALSQQQVLKIERAKIELIKKLQSPNCPLWDEIDLLWNAFTSID